MTDATARIDELVKASPVDLFKKGTGPIIKATRIITPRFVHDSHVGLVAFMLLLWIWPDWPTR